MYVKSVRLIYNVETWELVRVGSKSLGYMGLAACPLSAESLFCQRSPTCWVNYRWKIALLRRSLLLVSLFLPPGEHLSVFLLDLEVVIDLPGREARAERREVGGYARRALGGTALTQKSICSYLPWKWLAAFPEERKGGTGTEQCG